jgi:hypothetical protein
VNGELTAGWRELCNKAQAYRLVGLRRRRPLRGVAGAGGGPPDLAELVAEIYARWPQTAAFRLERLCYDHVHAIWRLGSPPHGLLTAADAPLPAAALPLLHAGLGMALARRLLRPPLTAGRPAVLAERLERLLDLVRANARPEYEAVAIESCGLVVRVFRPWLHGAVARWMAGAGRHLERLYWHGAGRGMYFLPGSLAPLPGSARRALARSRREPPDALTRQDALAGLAFAVTMVNWRQPWLIERVFHMMAAAPVAGARSHGGVATPEVDEAAEEDEQAAFASGVAACIFARRHTMPGEPSSVRPPVLAGLPAGGTPGAGDSLGFGDSPDAGSSGDSLGSSGNSPGTGGSWDSLGCGGSGDSLGAGGCAGSAGSGSSGDGSGSHGPRAAPRAERWESRVRRPCAAALEAVYPWLVERGELSRFALNEPLAPLLAAVAPAVSPAPAVAGTAAAAPRPALVPGALPPQR